MENERFNIIQEVDETIHNLINCGGGNLEGPITDYCDPKKDYQWFKGYLSYLQDHFGRDPKIASIKIYANSSRYYFKVKLNKGYKEPEPRYDDEWENKALEIIKNKFNEFEEQGTTYITSYKDILDDSRAKELINEHFIPDQDKWQIRNSGQYKLVEEKTKDKDKEIGSEGITVVESREEILESFKFDIDLDRMFYEDFEDDNLKTFLMDSSKVPIDENMAFIPIKLANKNNYYYILFVDSQIEDLSLFRIKNLRYINEQSNLYTLLKNLLPFEVTERQKVFMRFLRSFTNKLSESIISNERLLNELYDNLNGFYNDKRILKQFKYGYQDK
ncbi:hypothetical protein [Methanobacterium sp. ACI-7]|uniref:hypothetical protein n=1 Tax=unclassified Methanobacterium TaxID=2627676 RepID=UPI0039C120C3